MVNFHIEPTSKCTLECPLCDRTWFYKKFKRRNLHEINVEQIVKFVGTNQQVSLCGNNGDPIYHSRFLELCEKFKDNNCRIKVHTNGSGKRKAWWEKLNKILTKEDSVYFAIDGLEDTNHLYRKNAKWNSIMTAIEVFNDRECKMIWRFIPFKHNQHQITQARKRSKELSFDRFKLIKSDRWLDNKELMPDKEYVASHHEHKKTVLVDEKYETEMFPVCIKNNVPSNELYIDAEGDFYPCCWMGSHRWKYKSVFSPKKLKAYNIKNNTLNQILENDSIKKFFDSTKQFTSAHKCCKIQCGGKDGGLQ